MDLLDKTVVVTGGGRGIGRAIAIEFAKEGANVVIAARTESEVEETEKKVKETGSNGFAAITDVTHENDVSKLMESTIRKFGQIDILVNNAGVALRKPFTETTIDDSQKIMDVNVMGTFLCTQEALKYDPKMIINISSGAGKSGIPELSVYSASKFAVIGLTESIAEEMPQVKLYAICPGGVDTDMYLSLFGRHPDLKPDDIAKKVIETCKNEPDSGSSIEIYE